MKNSKLGFTLIELLVVISIIGILASLALVSYGGAQKQSRDAVRRSDLEQYRNALEGYAGANNGKYPGFSRSGVIQIGGNNLCTSNYLYPFMSDTCLTDPAPSTSYACGNDNAYQYCYFEDGTIDGATANSYLLYAKLETGGYWVVCSNGKAGKVTTMPTGVGCPLNTQPI